MRLWGLLGGLEPTSEMRVGFLLQQAERLSARVQALANELRSMDRDADAGQANVVLIEDSRAACPGSRPLRRTAAGTPTTAR